MWSNHNKNFNQITIYIFLFFVLFFQVNLYNMLKIYRGSKFHLVYPNLKKKKEEIYNLYKCIDI